MRAVLLAGLAGLALMLPVPAQADSLNSYFDDELAVPFKLSTGVVVTLRTVELVGEGLGRRLVLRADFDGPRPPSTSRSQLALEAEEAKEICQRYLPELARHLDQRPRRRITHLEVLYRETETHYRVDVHDYRGMRVDTRRHRCPGV